jgi:hypothetical protein
MAGSSLGQAAGAGRLTMVAEPNQMSAYRNCLSEFRTVASVRRIGYSCAMKADKQMPVRKAV